MPSYYYRATTTWDPTYDSDGRRAYLQSMRTLFNELADEAVFDEDLPHELVVTPDELGVAETAIVFDASLDLFARKIKLRQLGDNFEGIRLHPLGPIALPNPWVTKWRM